ncbi:ankyrin repeat domain-containing protein 26-like isoform X2 [Hemicordylus capensis]|uniref:ankyrin repeat domain-containing protein 26-like isoform X2 n=1 Tax=Hemicordylus capensis TaxID=884348 RepID=UPI0023028D8D|nr:ankyrin repeat domain-containing protein 26-like isoform X2 [Hemicordylus capensis]
MKKIFGFGKKRERQQSPSRPASGGATASPSGGEGGSLSGGGYEVWRSKDLGKLHRAAATGDLKKLQQLVRKHDLNQLDKANRTPLHLACASGYTDIVMFLVDNRCKLNLCDDDGKSPLMKAVQCQQELCATYLLEHGADTNLVDANGNTALHLAAFNASISIAQRLIKHNTRVDVQNKDGSTPLTIAITEDNQVMAEFLLKNGADIHFRDNAGRTPLLTAASHGKHNLVKLLFLHGADASHKDCNGWSAEDYAVNSGDPSLSQKIAEYANCRSAEKSSTGSKKDLSVFNSPDKAGDAGFTLGAAATNKEVVDDHSSDDSIRGSGRTDDSWCSSEGEELDFSPKKLQKPSLAQLMNVSQQLKKINEKSSIIRTERIARSQQNKSDCEAEDVSESLPLSQVKSFPHPVRSSPGSFSKCSQMTSHLGFKEDSSEEDEEKGDREEKMRNILNKKLKKYDSKAQNLLKDDIIRKAALASEADEEEDDKDTESPWDSECISESPRKPSVGFLPTSPSEVRSHMHSISEEPRNGKSDDLPPKTTEANVDHVGSYTPLVMGTETREKQKSDLMEKLGLGDADNIEDESDWDSTSVSLKSVPSGKPFNILILEDHESPLQLRTSDAATKTSEVFPVGPEELPGSQVIIASEDGIARIHADLDTRILAVPGDVPQQPSGPIVINSSQLIQPEEVEKIPGSVQAETCALDPCPSWLVKSAREGKGQQSNEEAIKETESDENEIYGTVGVNDFDDITQSSETATEDVELLSSVFRDAMILIEQLSLDKKDSASLLQFQNILHGYERLIEHEKERYTQLLEKVKKRESEKRKQQRLLKEMGGMKCVPGHPKAEWERGISSLKFPLKQEEEKRTSTEMYEKKQEQSRKKEKQYCKEMEEKQQLELMLRSLEMELRTLKYHLEEVEEEHRETQQQLAQEQNARALQEGILNTYLWKRKEMEEESKKIVSKSSEMADNHDQEKELWHKNKILQNELSVLKLELDHLRVRHQEEEANYLEENEILREKVEELKRDQKLNEEALSQTVAQYSGQLNASKAECAMLISKLEFVKENKERLEVELDSFRSRLSSSTQELEQCQLSRTDLERMLQREHNDWLHLKDKLNHDLCNLQETNNAMSQQLSKAESKGNSLESELHHVTHALREKNLLLESIQRDLSQAQCQVKELENARQVENDQINKYVVKQDSLQERLAHLQSENILLRQQFEDLQNKGIIKEKVVTDVQDKFNDILSELRADFEKQVQLMEERNKELVTKCNYLREQIFKYEAEKAEREGALRQLQQELADSLKNQSMSEASLEVTTRYRSDLEDDKRQLQKEIDRIKSKLQESEEQYIQSKRHIHDLRSALNAKEHETSVECQKLQDLLVVSSERNNTIKQLEEHIQRLEVENARLEATTKQQTGRIEILQKDLQDSVSVHHHLEELITSLQTSNINLEEQLSHQVQKQNMLSENAQDIHSVLEEQLKSRSKLGIRVSELETEKLELMSHLEDERKHVKKLLELKQSVEMQLDQETMRNNELQKECIGTKKLLKAAEKKLKDSENGECSSQTRFQEVKKRYVDTQVEKLRTKVNKLSHQLDLKSTRCAQLESTNHDLQEQLSSLKLVHKSNEKLKKRNQQLEEEVANLQRYLQGNLIEHRQIENYKSDIEVRARQNVRKKLEEVNMFLQTQAASHEVLEQIRASNNATVRNQLEHRIRELELELAREKSSKQHNLFRESNHTELEQYKALYSEEQKMRKFLGRKLDRANERLAEANAKILYERQRSRSLFASSFVSGSLSASPVLGTVQLGNLGSNVALNRTPSLGRGFISPTANALPSKNRAEAYLAKYFSAGTSVLFGEKRGVNMQSSIQGGMQTQLEKNITKELDQATAELDETSVRVSPLGSIDESSKT